jgi:hypothetical protein
MDRNRRGLTRVEVLVLALLLGVAACFLFCGLRSTRNLARRSQCRMNLYSIGKGICLYQNVYKDEYPALAGSSVFDDARLSETPTRVSEAEFLAGKCGGNDSVNAYFLLVPEGFVEAESFRCPSDERWEAYNRDGRFGFDGWRNISYALQPTCARGFPARVNSRSQDSMVIAADVKAHPKIKDKQWSTVGYEVNVLVADGSSRAEMRDNENDTASPWGYEGDEIYTQTQSTDPVRIANDSRLMGRDE